MDAIKGGPSEGSDPSACGAREALCISYYLLCDPMTTKVAQGARVAADEGWSRDGG